MLCEPLKKASMEGTVRIAVVLVDRGPIIVGASVGPGTPKIWIAKYCECAMVQVQYNMNFVYLQNSGGVGEGATQYFTVKYCIALSLLAHLYLLDYKPTD